MPKKPLPPLREQPGKIRKRLLAEELRKHQEANNPTGKEKKKR